MSGNLPLVSVVVPLYNYEDYVAETLDSILASDYPNVEIVIVDDGSRDRSLEIARSYADRFPTVRCYSQSNSGTSAARNNAIGKAEGKYILPVDADDLISPGFISLAVDILEKDPQAMIVVPAAEFIGKRQGPWDLPPFSLRLLARRNILSACALYRKADWERVGGYIEGIAREDWCFWIAMLKDGGKVVKTDHVGLYYRIHDVSRRTTDRVHLKKTIDKLNELHPEFFRRELGGPLRYTRSWSRTLNRIDRLLGRTKR